MKDYKAKLTSCLLWLQEARLTAQLMVEGYTREDIVRQSVEENIYNAPSEDRKRKIANTTYTRNSTLSQALLNKLAVCTVDDAKLIVILTIMLTDDLFHDFMVEVYKDRILTGMNQVSAQDVIMLIDEKRIAYESARKISDISQYKLGQTFMKYLVYADLINNIREGQIIKPYIDYELRDLLSEAGYRDYITILTGE